MRRAWIIAWRELRNYLQDKADLAFSLLLPVVTFALMYGAFGGQSVFNGTAYVVNEDAKGVYSEQLIEKLNAQENITVEFLTRTDAENKLDRSDLTLVLLIPAGFSDKLRSGQPAELTFMQRGNGGQEGQIVASIIRGTVSEINQDFQVRAQVEQALSGQEIPGGKITETTWQFLDRERSHPLIGVEGTAVGGNPDTVSTFLPGIITMYVLFAISIGAATLVEERRKGTLERLLTTRLTTGELFLGKFLSSSVRGLVQTFILLALSYAVFQIFTPVSFLVCLLIALVFAMAGAAIGIVIASTVRTQDAATWVGVVFTMAMTMLGGTFFEISRGSGLYILSRFSLNTYANDAFKTLISEGGSITDIWVELTVLAGVVVVGLVLSRVLFKAVPKGK